MAPARPEDKFDLQGIWKEAQDEFRKTKAGKKLGKRVDDVHILSVEEVIGGIDAQAEEDDEKHKTARKIFRNTMITVQNLGGLAASGASQVFGPSNLCFSALSYLITAGQNFRSIFHSIAEMFQNVTSFLRRFAVYVEKFRQIDLDPAMKGILHELLTSFVRICMLSVRVLNENKVLLYLKVFAFASDEGVSGELARLQSLVANEAAMRGTLTFGSVMNSERNIAVGFSETKEGITALGSAMERLTKGEEEKKRDAIGNQQRETIKNALGDSAEKSYREILTKLSIGSARQTGTWLKQNSQFITWTGLGFAEHPILCISGDEGFGKSYLVSSVIRHLRKRYPQGSQDPDRTSVAYYFFQEDKELQSLNNALRAMVWQIVLNDVAYQKDAAGVCKDPDNLSSNDDLWDRLFSDFMDTRATFYLILDGIDHINLEERKSFLRILRSITSKPERERQLRVRFLLAGRPKSLEDLGFGSVATIDLRHENNDDIKTFVAERTEDIEVLKGESNQMQKLREQVFEAVTNGAHGDFVKTGMTLEEISTKSKPSEIRTVLVNAGEPRAEVIKNQIKRLQVELKETDVQDLNVLLAWVTRARRNLTLSELDMILYKRNGERSFRFEQQIRDKYSVLFRISEGDKVKLLSPSIIEYLADQTAPIIPAEVNIVRRFLKSVCDDDLYGRFGFEEFFTQRLERPATKIIVDPNDAEVLIIKGCLDLICDAPPKEAETLVEYARQFLPIHLATVDLSLPGLSSKDRSKIGTQLLHAFWKEDIIGRWWPVDLLCHTDRKTWLYDKDDTNVGAVLGWLRNSTVTRDIDGDGLVWVKALTSNSQPDEDLLKPITKAVAKEWLQGPADSVLDDFRWVHGFVTKINSRKGSGKRSLTDSDPGDLKKSDIDATVQWAATELGVEEQDSLWKTNVACTFLIFDLLDDAIENFRLALELDKANWDAHYRLADIYQQEARYDSAIEALAYPMQEFRDNEALVAEHRSVYYLMTTLLGHCYEKKSEYNKAIELYQAELRRDPEAWELVEALMNALRAGKKYDQLMNFIEELSNDWIDGFGGSRLTKMSHELATSSTYHSIFFEAAKATDNLPLVIKAYENAIDRAKADPIDQEDIDRIYLVNRLSHHYGVLLFYSDTKDGREEAVRLWEQNLRDTNGKTDFWPEVIRYQSRERLCLAYLQNAKTAELDAEVAKNNVGKLADLCINLIYGGLFSILNADPRLILGRGFHLLQQEEEAMASLRGQVKIALDLLSDDDPGNDWQGYEMLATVLMYIDDDLNAQAAWSLIRPYDEPKAILGGRLFAHGPLSKFCAGNCGHQWWFADAIYVCRDCLDVCFDKKCWELVKTKRAVFPVCDHRHDFLYVPEWKVDGQQHVKPGMVKVGDTIVPIDEWLTAIRTKWGLVHPTICGVVKYDFKAEKPDELEAKTGEAITIIAISSPEWFVAKPIGRLGGVGLIPVSFVEVRDMATGQTIADPKEAVRRAGVSSVEELKVYGLMPSVIPQT